MFRKGHPLVDRSTVIEVAAATIPSHVGGGVQKMDEVDKVAIECVKLETQGSRNTEQVLKSKDSLLRISMIRSQPILKCEKKYAVLDGEATVYIYDDK
jgi:hypothetical protein